MSDSITEEVDNEEIEQDETIEQNVLDMSDEEFENAPIPDEIVAEDVEVVDNDNEEEEEVSTEEVDVSDESTEVGDTSDTTDKDDSVDNTNEEDTDKETSKINYQAEHEKLLGKFKANGKDMQVSSVEDAITLMKMGANYNKKMAGLKPNMKLLKMLENNNLLDESKLSYLIDLEKKNPEAVKKMIKDSGIDPLDVDLKKDTEYKPGTYTVDDNEVELDGVLDEIRDTASFEDTIDIISNKWDASSKKVLVDNPAIIKVINEHVDSGIYEQINTIIESERMLGRLANLSDLEAYKQVGDVLQANGSFNQQQQEQKPAAAAPKKAIDPKLKSRKKAASSTKTTISKKVNADFNPLALSDEEFDKIAGSNYL